MAKASETGEIREKRTDVGKNRPPKDKQFSSTNQPDPEKQKATKAKKRVIKETIRALLETQYKFAPDSQLKKQMVAAFGADVLKKPILEVMALQQVQKAILKGDTQAFTALLDRVDGRPVQAIAETDPDGNELEGVPIKLTFPKGMKFELPSNTEGDDTQV